MSAKSVVGIFNYKPTTLSLSDRRKANYLRIPLTPICTEAVTFIITNNTIISHEVVTLCYDL